MKQELPATLLDERFPLRGAAQKMKAGYQQREMANGRSLQANLPPSPLPGSLADNGGGASSNSSGGQAGSLDLNTQEQHSKPSSSNRASASDGEAEEAGTNEPKLAAAPAAADGGDPQLAPGTLPAQQDLPCPRCRVVLRVEVATKGQARLLTYSIWVLNILFVVTAAGLLTSRETDVRVGDLIPYYTAELVIGCVCLLVHIALLIWFTISIRSSQHERRVWSKRQGYFTRTAAMLLGLQIPYSATFVGAFIAVLNGADCSYPWRWLAAMEFVQWIFFASLMLFLLARLHNMTMWRGPGALDMPPDFRLMVDRPAHELVRNHRVIFIIWLSIMAVSLASMIDKLTRYSVSGTLTFEGGCDALLDDWTCGTSTSQIVVAMCSFVLILAYCFFWVYYMWRALKDHEQLPYSRYRSTLIFVRVQLRVVAPVLLAVVASVLFLTVIPSFRESCWASMDAQMGNLPVDMALTVSTVVMTILYMPKAQALDSPVLQEFLQTFTWTVDGMPIAVEERNQLLLDTETAREPAPGPGHEANLMNHLHEEMRHGLAKLTGVPDLQQAAAQLRKEPMFCMETAAKMFLWIRLAYRDEDALNHPFVNAKVALPLFRVEHFETIWDDSTDTQAVMGWSNTQVVVAFRGTQSLQNVMTDLKAWMTPMEPRRKRQGRTVRVHTGFNTAWVHNGFNLKVLARLRELDQGPTPVRFWIAGHSLGGALALLAALEIRREHPTSQLTCYTFGCPKVGNAAFAEEYDLAVPDTWVVINGLDPIPWMPGFGFTPVGKQVTINPKGDLILRPTYFELSVMHRGMSAKHHLTGSYAMSLAAVLRAQFVESKALPGGPEGVAALVAAVDLAKCLVLSNMDLESLASHSKERQPVFLEVLTARAAAAQRHYTMQGTGSRINRAGCRLLLLPCGCGHYASGCMPFSGGRAAKSDGATDAERTAEQHVAAEGAGEGDVPQGSAARQQQQHWWQRPQQLRQLESMDLSSLPTAVLVVADAQPTRRHKLKLESLHLKQYPAFRSGRLGEEAVLELGDVGQQGASQGSQQRSQGSQQLADEQPQASQAAEPEPQHAPLCVASGMQLQLAGSMRCSTALSESMQLMLDPECSVHSALSHPEQLPILDPSSDGLTD